MKKMSRTVPFTTRLHGGHVLTKVLCRQLRGAVVSTAVKTTSQVRHTSTEATFDIQVGRYSCLTKPSRQGNCARCEGRDAGKPLPNCEQNDVRSSGGQEAIAVGIKAVMRPQDSVITAYRCHAWTYIMGVSALGVIAELTGRKSGCARGKGGSMHMYGEKFYGGNGIVGGQVPLGTGVGLAHKYRGDGGICFTLYGDGAANQGQVFEAFNIAKLWVLPVVFICENNKYGLGTRSDRSSASTDYYTRGDYIPGIWVDGMDVLATREAARFAIEWITSGKGPIVIEMETYRYYGHSMSDPGTSYRSREEVQEVRKTRDPITGFKEKILSKKLVTPEKLKEVDAYVRQHVDAAAKQSATDPEVGVEELTADVYVDSIQPHIRGVLPDKPLPHLSIAKRN